MAMMTLNKQEIAYFFSVPKEQRDSEWETKIIRRLARLVKRVAQISYEGYHGNKRDILGREDFESLAYMGLLQAVREYEPSLGSFHSYSSVCIQNSIKHALLEKRGRDEFKIISLREVPEIVTDGGVEDVLDMVFLEGLTEYFFNRFEKILTKKEFTVLYRAFASGEEKKSDLKIAYELHMSRASVELAKRRAIKKIRRCMEPSIADWKY